MRDQWLWKMRLVRAVKHIGQNAEKFRFDLKVENLHVLLHEECEVTIDWVRGPKRISGKETVVCVNGSIIHPFYQPMVLIATLFQKSSQKQGRAQQNSETFLPKDSRLVIYGKFKENPLVTLIGEVPLELSSFANSHRQTGYEVSEPTKVEIPLIKCSDPDSYIEAYITCCSLGQVSEGFDDTASMMSGFTTVFSGVEVAENPSQSLGELKTSFAGGGELLSYKKGTLGRSCFEAKKDVKQSLCGEGTLGIPMFSIKEDVEVSNEAVREAEELTETATMIDVEVNSGRVVVSAVPEVAAPAPTLTAGVGRCRDARLVEEAAPSGGTGDSNSQVYGDGEGEGCGQKTAVPSYYPSPVVKLPSRSVENFKAFEVLSEQGRQARISSPQSSTSYEILTQRLYMEQEEYKRRMCECTMEINSLRQQLQIYSEQEKSWKKREADLMSEIMLLRNSEDFAEKEGEDDKKVVGSDDYCLLQQEVSELTGIRDELRRLRESDRLNYEKYITQLENQIQDVTRQLEVYQASGQIQDEVEEEIFSVPKHPSSYATANSLAFESLNTGRAVVQLPAPAVNGEDHYHCVEAGAAGQTSSAQAKDGRQQTRAGGGSSSGHFSYGFEEIERELISTKLALAQTETNYQIEINNLRSRLEKQRKQLLSYSSYVGSLEVINADLKYGARNNKDFRSADGDLDENIRENQSDQPCMSASQSGTSKSKSGGNLNAINSYWKTFKQRIR